MAIVPVSGQDGDTANLQNVAAGTQYVDVWKDANQLGKAAGAAALQLCEGPQHRQRRECQTGLLDPNSCSGQGLAVQGLHDAC